jgi:glyoxylase-like metal-dependent hydrolase (beta-lactamase superfamily II)
MSAPLFEPVADGIWCIDTGLYRPGLAACYLVRGGDGHLAFIDTGTTHTVPLLMATLAALGHTPDQVDYVIPTHVHLDHAGGAGALMQRCPRATLAIHPKGASHMIDPTRLTAGATQVYGEAEFTAAFGDLVAVPEGRVLPLEDGAEIDLGGRVLRFLDTPGHANHHGCLYDVASRGCFTGDTFGIAYRELYSAKGPYLFAPTTPVAFDPEAWELSLDRLMALNPQAMYLTHYGRLDRPADLVETLRHSIRNHAAMALAAANPFTYQGHESRLERLRAAVARHLVGGAQAHGCTLDEAAVREVLAVDLDLNAQGLEIWLTRLERKGRPA